ncbi:TonB-dependent receptor [Asticcacaulis sp. 201]|uniref:TonB-dependent receptor n=1 Tax=Asticcacaulis sp. 201 TaxID=3028787 RepID=UPI002916219B|nr:TonB-dependent receptor [Asticcacaulis sp. 201]MDV6329214.1 TonB-dependent receptor [Asticcacaulis sp. 201]
MAQDSTEVVVVGKKPDAIEKIDRLSYDIESDPDAQTGVILDILRKLPSVTVSSDGKVQLRGANVTILIDGKVPADGNAVVKVLASADVERIEVITNPSAQFAPDGTGGIINIVTRKRRKVHLSGDLNLQANTLGQAGLSLSTTINSGPWSAGGQLRLDHGRNRTRLFERQAALNPDGGYDVLDREDHLHTASDEATGGLSLEYRLSPRSSLSFKGNYGNYDAMTKGWSHYSGIADYDETSLVTSGSHNGDVLAQYDYRGDANNETLSLSFDHSDYANLTRSTYDRGDGDLYGTISDIGGNSDRVQGDYERRFGRRLLTAGLSIDRTFNRDVSRLDSRGTDLDLAVSDYDYAFSGTRTISAIYATWQTPWGRWTLLPGMRLEAAHLNLVGDVGVSDLTLYPSLHISRYLNDTDRVKFSFSRRVSRPSIGEYNPNIQYWGNNLGVTGNLALKPQFTNAYEAAYDRNIGDFGMGATLYFRDTRGSFSPYSLVTADGLLLSTSINSGRSRSGGTELTLHGKVSKRVKYAINANLYYTQAPYIDGYVQKMRGRFSGSGNGLLEYNAPNGDQFQINLTGFGRRLTYQGQTSGAWRADMTYRRPLTDKVAVVVSMTDLFNSFHFRSVVDTALLKTESEGEANMRAIKIALSYRFGDGGR